MHIRAELTDLIVYWVTLEDQIQLVWNLLELAKAKDDPDTKNEIIDAVLNVLDTGNVGGNIEEELNEDAVWLAPPQLTLFDV